MEINFIEQKYCTTPMDNNNCIVNIINHLIEKTTDDV